MLLTETSPFLPGRNVQKSLIKQDFSYRRCFADLMCFLCLALCSGTPYVNAEQTRNEPWQVDKK